MKNSILLRRKHKLIVEAGHDRLPEVYLATTLTNLSRLGYTFSVPLMERLRTLSADAFTNLYKTVVEDLKQMVGAHVTFNPMYPNFPAQVMEASLVELCLNAFIHYATFGQWVPAYAKEERLPLLDQVELKVIDLGTDEEFDQMITALIRAKSSISATDKADVAWVLASYDNLDAILPSAIPLKENVAFVVATLLQNEKAFVSEIACYFKTATDVLRLAVALSGGDVSLPGIPRVRRSNRDTTVVLNEADRQNAKLKFRKFKRAERRLLLELLDQCTNIAENMVNYKGLWKTLASILHPAEFKGRYPNARRAFDALRNNTIRTFGTEFEAALTAGDGAVAVALLKTRPGEFARRLDVVLRIAANQQQVVDQFAEVAHSVATPVLLQAMSFFEHRNDGHELRTFFPKGNVAKLKAFPNRLPVLSAAICADIVVVCQSALIKRFATLPSLGKVFVDGRLRQYLVPFAMRAASKSLRTLVRGSQVPFPEGNTIRFFTWWKEGAVNGTESGPVDLDLSAVVYDGDWNLMEQIFYRQLRSYRFEAVHSGDMVQAPHGACECLDFDIKSVLRQGGRYVVASLNVFHGPALSGVPEAFAGWMMRQYPGSGEVFEPATVQDKIDLAADTKICIPMILDLLERRVTWCDLALKRQPNYVNNVVANQGNMALMGKAMTTLKRPSLYDLFLLHALSRGEIVSTAEEADTIFGTTDGVTPFDTEKIMAEFLV